MASIRRFKNDVEYLVSEVVSDCYTCVVINENVDKDKVFSIINDAVALRNELVCKINNPTEKHNRKINKKYYAQLRHELITKVEGLFSELSACFNK